MRKFLFSILLSLLFIPVLVKAEGVSIKSIELDSKSDNTTVKSEPTYEGLELNFDLGFKAKDDFAKYKVIIKNDTDTDYKISEDTSFNESEWKEYSISISFNSLLFLI